jgi:hypothetical protein
LESDPVSRERIEEWRCRPIVSPGAQVIGPQRVERDQHHVWPPGRLQTIDESIGYTFVADREGEILDPGRGRLLEALRFARQGDVIMGCGLNAGR